MPPFDSPIERDPRAPCGGQLDLGAFSRRQRHAGRVAAICNRARGWCVDRRRGYRRPACGRRDGNRSGPGRRCGIRSRVRGGFLGELHLDLAHLREAEGTTDASGIDTVF